MCESRRWQQQGNFYERFNERGWCGSVSQSISVSVFVNFHSTLFASIFFYVSQDQIEENFNLILSNFFFRCCYSHVSVFAGNSGWESRAMSKANAIAQIASARMRFDGASIKLSIICVTWCALKIDFVFFLLLFFRNHKPIKRRRRK